MLCAFCVMGNAAVDIDVCETVFIGNTDLISVKGSLDCGPLDKDLGRKLSKSSKFVFNLDVSIRVVVALLFVTSFGFNLIIALSAIVFAV